MKKNFIEIRKRNERNAIKKNIFRYLSELRIFYPEISKSYVAIFLAYCKRMSNISLLFIRCSFPFTENRFNVLLITLCIFCSSHSFVTLQENNESYSEASVVLTERQNWNLVWWLTETSFFYFSFFLLLFPIFVLGWPSMQTSEKRFVE